MQEKTRSISPGMGMFLPARPGFRNLGFATLAWMYFFRTVAGSLFMAVLPGVYRYSYIKYSIIFFCFELLYTLYTFSEKYSLE